MFWTDNMCIPLYAQNPKDAMMLMDLLLRPGGAGRGRVLQRLRVPGALGPAGDAEPQPAGRNGPDGAGKAEIGLARRGAANAPTVFPTATYLKAARNYFPFKSPEELTAWNNLFLPITQGNLGASRRRVRPGKVLAPYLLSLPAGLWLLILFLIPLVVMLSLSLQSCNPATGACVMTWHWAEFGQQLSLYHTQFVTSI